MRYILGLMTVKATMVLMILKQLITLIQNLRTNFPCDVQNQLSRKGLEVCDGHA
jgi:hypothetical protein